MEYEYDDNGNLVKDLNRNISSIEYNSLNLHQRCEPRLHSAKQHKVSLPSLARALPEKVEMKHQVNSSLVSYGYDGMGRKLYE